MQLTIEQVSPRDSLTYSYHASFVLQGGAIYAISRDARRSVSRTLSAPIARYALDGEGERVACFVSDTWESSLLATYLSQQGWRVYGASVREGAALVAYRPDAQGYCASLTHPASIRKAISGGSGDRVRSLTLGSVEKGERGARQFGRRTGPVDVAAMRAAIEKVRASR